MKTIKSEVRANGNLAYDLDVFRSFGARTSSIKRTSRRQVRHRLASVMRMETAQHLAEAAELARPTVSKPVMPPVHRPSATIIAFPTSAERLARAVTVVRKLGRATRFQRQQVEIGRLAA